MNQYSYYLDLMIVNQKTLIKWLALYVNRSPKTFPRCQKRDQQKDGTKPTDFKSDRAAALLTLGLCSLADGRPCFDRKR